ncbi:egg cell-secreted protein 1.2-like [Durio zibethinus]|uniref:Egg cell-secreted protein 1.2-like n=1 Tax=Durio zibethinus TaxID=66656 RepID=A0A6P5ZGL1_DURZI|nr:egg cell-secreted protein 1.2-like [Durio zibethinus]
MSKRAEATICWLLLATCSAVLVQPGLAQLLPPNLGVIPNLPGLLPPGTPLEIQQCWSALTNIQGCVWEILRSVLSAQFGSIGPDCCKAITTVNENCWPKMFPLNPFFPYLLKGNCARVGAAPPAPK